MRTQGSSYNAAVQFVKVGTPDVDFATTGNLKITGLSKDFAKSTYHTRLHREIIDAQKNIRYNTVIIRICYTLLFACLLASLCYLLDSCDLSSLPTQLAAELRQLAALGIQATPLTCGIGIPSLIMLCFRLRQRRHYRHRHHAASAALNGEALHQYTSVTTARWKLALAAASSRCPNWLRRLLALVLLICYAIFASLLLYKTLFSIILVIPVGTIAIILYSAIWPSKSRYQRSIRHAKPCSAEEYENDSL